MAIKLRSAGSPLLNSEIDGNFTDLDGRCTSNAAAAAAAATAAASASSAAAAAAAAAAAKPALQTGALATSTTEAASPSAVLTAIAAAIATLTQSAPGLLNTFAEIAAALGNDPNLATTLMDAINQKASTAALAGHTSATNNPHSVTKTQVGLGNVDNTSDANKPVSTAQAAAIAAATSSAVQLVTHTDALPLDTPGFGKAASAVITLSAAHTLSAGGSPVPRGAYEVTFKGDGNSAHGVTIPGDWIRLGGPTAVSTALDHLTRMLVEFDADIPGGGKPTYVLQDIVASGTAAGAVLMDGPSAGVVGVASTNFTVQADGSITGTVVVTPNDNSGGGTFTPTTVNLTSGSPIATFVYTPASTGVKTIRATNNAGLTNPADLPYVSNPVSATAVTMSGPSSGTNGVASTNFTIGANGGISGTIRVTPHDAANGGAFTPPYVDISAGSPTATFVYTPASTGAKTISVTNDRALTNPANITYTSTGTAAFFEDNFVGMTGTLNGRTPSISNANGNTWVDPAGVGIAQYGAMSVGVTEGILMDMGSNASWRFDLVCQISGTGTIVLTCKDDSTQQSHLNYMFDMFTFDMASGHLELWHVGPSWDTFDDIGSIGDVTPPDPGVLHTFSLEVNDTAHTAKFYIDNVQVGTTQTIRTNAGRNDLRFWFGSDGGYVTHAKAL